jgi:hypothetical protein
MKTIEQQLVGTWAEEGQYANGRIWIFNSNETLSVGSTIYKYGAAGNKLIYYNQSAWKSFEYTFSSDDRTLILQYVDAGTLFHLLLRKRT